MNGEGTGISKCEGRDVHRLEVLNNGLSQFQVAEVNRAVPTCPLTPRSTWTIHFAFFDLCYDIWREGGILGGMQRESTMCYLEEIVLLSKK